MSVVFPVSIPWNCLRVTNWWNAGIIKGHFNMSFLGTIKRHKESPALIEYCTEVSLVEYQLISISRALRTLFMETSALAIACLSRRQRLYVRKQLRKCFGRTGCVPRLPKAANTHLRHLTVCRELARLDGVFRACDRRTPREVRDCLVESLQHIGVSREVAENCNGAKAFDCFV